MDMAHDIMLEIFSWLPAKSLYKFKCVNKFCNTISSPENSYFNLKQSQNALLRDDSCFFLQPNWMQRHAGKIEFYHLSSKNTTSGASHGFFQFLEHYRPACRIIASSKGLILGRSDTELFICNPVTQSWLPIPTPDYMEKYPDADLRVVLDFNMEDSKDFMLVLCEVQGEWGSSYLHLKFYSVKERMWKSVEASFVYGGRNLRFDIHVYYRKALHFISGCSPYFSKKSPYFRPYIMAYAIEDGSSRMIRIPKEARTDYEIGKWRRVLKIRVKAMGVKEEDHVHVTGFIVMNGDKLIFATEMKIYGYGLRQKNFMKLEEICEHGFGRNAMSFTAYSDTLHPCGHTAVTLPLMQQH
ncbi:hypothetical protein K1719_034272 [Acacia pycnantha]|nr:hypothetical protein K1719_034272 [Acacia pycnantha]